MADFFRVSAVFLFMLLLIRRKIDIGYVLLLGAVALGLAFGEPVLRVAGNVWAAVADGRTLAILLLVILITFLGRLLKQIENLRVMIESLEGILRDRRGVMAGAAALIGLMPMPGGAMLSAPLVGEVAAHLDLTPERKTVINYWFRHVWEYTFPLYPGIILTAAIMRVPLLSVSAVNLPLTFTAIAVGTALCFRHVHGPLRLPAGEQGRGSHAKRLAQVLWPIAAVLVCALLFKYGLPALGLTFGAGRGQFEWLLLLPLATVNLALLLAHELDWATTKAIARDSKPVQLCVLVFGVMVFSRMIEVSGAAEGMARSLQRAAVPGVMVISLLPFLVGLLTGWTAAVVGTAFPLLFSLMQSPGGGTSLAAVPLAYGCGFVGVLLSPVHLCLVLSKDYFEADLAGVYRIMVVPCLCVFAAAWAAWALLTVLGPHLELAGL